MSRDYCPCGRFTCNPVVREYICTLTNPGVLIVGFVCAVTVQAALHSTMSTWWTLLWFAGYMGFRALTLSIGIAAAELLFWIQDRRARR